MIHIVTSAWPALLFVGGVVVIYFLWATIWIQWLLQRRRSAERKASLTNKPAMCLHVFAVTGIICILYGYFVEPCRLQVSHLTIETGKLQNARFRVVHVSDLHCDNKIRLEDELPATINALNPDIIVFTGDALNRASALDLFKNTLQQMDAPLGKFAVKGNWDTHYWGGLDLFSHTGFTELLSANRTVEKDGEAIVVSGASYDWQLDMPPAFSPEVFNLFLYHTTDLVDSLGDEPVDLYLCGHTHGGQIALPFYGALVTLSRHGKKYEAGLYRLNDLQIYVNRGIGMEGGRAPRVRFLARPEVTVFDIVPLGSQ